MRRHMSITEQRQHSEYLTRSAHDSAPYDYQLDAQPVRQPNGKRLPSIREVQERARQRRAARYGY